MKLKIEKIDRSRSVTFTDQKSNQPVTKLKVGVLSGGRWYGCFADKWNEGWKEGQEIDVDVVEDQRNGKTFYNLRKPTEMLMRLKAIEEKIDKLTQLLTRKPNPTVPVGFGNDAESAPNEESFPDVSDDVPF